MKYMKPAKCPSETWSTVGVEGSRVEDSNTGDWEERVKSKGNFIFKKVTAL